MNSTLTSQTLSNLKRKRLFIFSSVAGIIAAFCWTVADYLLVGFGEPTNISVLEGKGLVGGIYIPIISLMVNNSTEKLMLSTQLAYFTAPLYMLSVYHIYHKLRLANFKFPLLLSTLLLLSYCFFPMAHSSYFFLIENYKAIVDTSQQVTSNVLDINANNYLKILLHNEMGVYLFGFIAWIWYLVVIVKKKSSFKRIEILFSPLIISIIIYAVTAFCSDYISSAVRAFSGNLSLLVFFLASSFIKVKNT